MNKRALLCITLILSISVFWVGADENKRILLLVDSSDFKDQLADEITTLATDSNFDVSIKESVKKIKDWPLDEYAAIIVLNRGTAGHMNRRLMNVLEEGSHPGMVIVTTYADPAKSKDRYEDYEDIDGITTASLKKDSDISKLAQEIMLSLKKVLP